MIALPRTPLFTAALLTALLTAFLIIFGGCAPKVPDGLIQDTPAQAWDAFRRSYCVPPEAPAMKVKASLYYSQIKPRKRTNRTIMNLWGDFNGPMRLDVAASVGTLLAHIRENHDGLLVFYPGDEEAYTHVDPVLGATRLGMPFPFSLSELANVLAGDFSGLAPAQYAEVSVRANGEERFDYTIDDGLVNRIVLDQLGRPYSIEGQTTKKLDSARNWRLEINRYAEAPEGVAPLPDKITLSLDNGERGVLHIKSRELMVTTWPAKSMILTLPDTVEPIRLDNGRVNTQTGDIPVVYEDK